MLMQIERGYPAAADTPIPSRPTLRGLHVLVLDDDPLAAIIATLDLEDADATFELAHCTHSAHVELDRSIAGGKQFHAAVLDVNLGGGRTSRCVAERLRAMGVPFVFHTAEPQAIAGDASWSDASGNAPAIGKPSLPGALAAALAGVVERRR